MWDLKSYFAWRIVINTIDCILQTTTGVVSVLPNAPSKSSPKQSNTQSRLRRSEEEAQHLPYVLPKHYLLPCIWSSDHNGHPIHSYLHKESHAELMLLTFVWDETASGTVRSKTAQLIWSFFVLDINHRSSKILQVSPSQLRVSWKSSYPTKRNKEHSCRAWHTSLLTDRANKKW